MNRTSRSPVNLLGRDVSGSIPARAATPGAFAKARQQIKPTTRAPITDEP